MIGSDFEQFLTVQDTLVPVTDALQLGSKFGEHVPLKHGTMHRDNVMVELCIHPAATAQAFAQSCVQVSEEAQSFLTTVKGLRDVRLEPIPVARFNPKELLSREAKEIGCDTDYLAQDALSVERPRIISTHLADLRCAGGHIHISYGCTDKIPEAIAAGFCDVALGALELQMGTQAQRRNFYGLAGLHRRKEYGKVKGVEYRTVSNLWLRKREYAEAMGHNALALERLFNNCDIDELSNTWTQLIAGGKMEPVLRFERRTEGTSILQRLRDMFPSYGFAVGV